MHSTNGTKQNTVSKTLFFFFEKIEIETALVIINREKIQIPILFEKILLIKSIIVFYLFLQNQNLLEYNHFRLLYMFVPIKKSEELYI